MTAKRKKAKRRLNEDSVNPKFTTKPILDKIARHEALPVSEDKTRSRPNTSTAGQPIVRNITERKLAENVDARQLQELRQVLDSAVAQIWYLDREGRVVNCNRVAEKVSGVTLEQARGKTIHTLAPTWDDLERRHHESLTVIRTGRPLLDSLESFRLDGETRWVRVDKVPWRDADGAILGVLMFIYDVTERKRAEDELRESEARYRALFDNANDALYFHDDEGKFIDVNKVACERLGYSREQLLGMSLKDVNTPESAAAIPKKIRRIREEGRAVFEAEEVRRDGSRFPVEVSVRPLCYKGKPAMLGISRDITDRRRVEHELSESENRYRLLFENSTDAILLTATDGRIFAANPEACRILQRTENEIRQIGRNEVVDLQDPRLPLALKERARTGRFRGELSLKRKDGSIFPAEVATNVFKAGNEPEATAMIIRDLTERKRMEEDLRESEERVRSLFNRVLDGIYRSTHEGRFVDVNPALAKMFGYSSTQEMLDILDIKKELYFSPEERGRHLLDTNQEEVKEYRMRRKDGSEIWVEDHGYYIHDEQGNIVFHEGILRDITERRRLEGELRRSTQFFESVIENASVWMDVIDPEGNVLVWNKAAESISGYSRAEVVGHGKVWEWLYPDEKYRRWVADMVPPPQQENEASIRRKDGEIRMLAWNERRLVDENGEVIGVIIIGRDITEQKRMHDEIKRYSEHLEEMVKERTQQLAESEKRFREMANLLPQIIFETDLTGNYTFANRSGLVAGRYTEEDILNGLNAFQTFAEQDRGRALENFGKVVMGLDIGPSEYTALRKDGSTFPVLVHTTPIVRERKVIGVRGVAMDITEQKRMEERLRNSEARFSELAHLLPQIIFETDEKGNYTFVNRSGLAAAGYTEDDILHGLNAIQTFVEEDREKIKLSMGRLLHGEDLRANEYTVQRKDGTTFPILIHSLPIMRDGKPVGVRGVAMDITERKRMEEELQAAKKRLEYVIASNPAVIFTGKPLPDCSEWRSSYYSERVTSMLGFEPRELIGNPELWKSRIHPDDLRPTISATSHLKEGHYACDYRFLHKDGMYRWIHEEAILVRDAVGEPFEVVGCWTDITELKNFEQRLTQAEHLAAIGETAAMVGHDLRNPLQGIAGAIYLLRHESLSMDERDEMLDIVENCVEYSDGIVKDLLDYARPFELTRAETTPKKITRSALEAVRVPDRIQVQDQTREQPLITVDSDRMRRVFINLIENAIDAMPNGGTLTVSSKESDGFVEILFSDTGAGIPKELVTNLWKPLQTTKAKGMGYGLAIVKRIIDAHNGEIAVNSKEGEGTTFTIRIPSKTRT